MTKTVRFHLLWNLKKKKRQINFKKQNKDRPITYRYKEQANGCQRLGGGRIGEIRGYLDKIK